jgi:hypothetical protein
MSATNQLSSFFKQSPSSIIIASIVFVLFTTIPSVVTFYGHDYWNVTGEAQPKFPMNLLMWLPNFVNLVLSGVLGYTFIKVYQLSFLIEENAQKSNALIEENAQKSNALIEENAQKFNALIKEQSDKMKEMGEAILFLHKNTKEATISAFTALHFELYGEWENANGDKYTYFKCFDTKTHGQKGFLLGDGEFDMIYKWLSNRYDKNGTLSYKERIEIENYFVNKVKLT